MLVGSTHDVLAAIIVSSDREYFLVLLTRACSSSLPDHMQSCMSLDFNPADLESKQIAVVSHSSSEIAGLGVRVAGLSKQSSHPLVNSSSSLGGERGGVGSSSNFFHMFSLGETLS